MSLEFKMAITGSLREILGAQRKAGQVAAKRAIEQIATENKLAKRAQIEGAGLGRKLANTIRSKVYPNRPSLRAAALIYSNASYMVAFTEGTIIRPQGDRGGGFMAIPTQEVPKGRNGKHIGPGEWERMTGRRLRFVFRRGAASLLVADNMRMGKRGFGVASKTAIAKGNTATVVLFILVPQVNIKKRLDFERVDNDSRDKIAPYVVQEWERAAQEMGLV